MTGLPQQAMEGEVHADAGEQGHHQRQIVRHAVFLDALADYGIVLTEPPG